MKTTHTELATGLRAFAQRQPVKLTAARYLTEFGVRRFSIEDSRKVSELKERVASDLANQFNGLNRQLIRQVVNEADSLAATTPYPALLLPALAEEKARAAAYWAARQQLIREQTLVLAA